MFINLKNNKYARIIIYIFKYFFSIITPVKNGSKYIDTYLNSLNNQIFENWES